MDAAALHGRKVCVVGRSMVDNVKMSLDMGYLKDPIGVLVPLNALRRLKPHEVVIMTTGSQGEPTSALVRIANGDHQEISIQPGDTVVISASPIPGNENVVSRTIDNLFRQGAEVLYDRIATVHVHGHASREELKIMLNITRPKFFVPVHGEYRHLISHCRLAQELGTPEERTFALEDGDVLELDAESGRVVDKVQAGHIYVDGLQLWDPDSTVLRDRRTLSRDGIVMVVLTVDKHTGKVLRTPEVVSMGFVEPGEYPDLMARAAHAAMSAVERKGAEHPLDWSYLTTAVKRRLSDFLYEETHLRPLIIPVPVEV